MKKVEVTIDINVSPDIVMSAFTDIGMLKGWWDVERALIGKSPGGAYILTWNVSIAGFGFVSTGIIREYNSMSTLVIDNYTYLNPTKSILGPMTLTIKVQKKDDKLSTLYLCQDGYQQGGDWDWYYEAVTHAWPIVVKRLKSYLENHNVTTPLQ
jgi:uncharacterized protein YndB with AHSA1/START domain